jgi:hypothetical protein
MEMTVKKSPTPWSVKTHVRTMEDGSTEVVAWEIVDADGLRVVPDVCELDIARDIVARANAVACAGRAARTDRDIVEQTNALAIVAMRYIGTGYEVPDGYRIFEHLDGYPREEKAWAFACEVQRLMTDTDPNDALAIVEDEGGVQQATSPVETLRAEREARRLTIFVWQEPDGSWRHSEHEHGPSWGSYRTEALAKSAARRRWPNRPKDGFDFRPRPAV